MFIVLILVTIWLNPASREFDALLKPQRKCLEFRQIQFSNTAESCAGQPAGF